MMEGEGGGAEPEMDGGIFVCLFFFDGRDLLVFQRSTKESSDAILCASNIHKSKRSL